MAQPTYIDWLRDTFDPAAFAAIDRLFPNHRFTQDYRGNWLSPLKLDGSDPHKPRKDKTIISSNNPAFALEQGGGSVRLIDWYAQLNGGLDEITAVNQMATILGLPIPTFGQSTPDTIGRANTVTALNDMANTMANALHSPKGAATLDYLRNRGYKSDYIDYLTNVARIGYIDTDTAAKLQPLFAGGSTWPKGVGTTHTLAIPHLSGGRIVGFAFRAIDTLTNPKYTGVWAKGYTSQQAAFYGLQQWGYKSPNTRGERYLCIVEGQFDAIAAAFHGIPNVVAAGGLDLQPQALQAAKARNVDSIVLMLDNDQAGQNINTIERAATKAAEQGLRVYVGTLPPIEGIVKVDLDTYLNTYHGSPDTIQAAINTALPAALYLGERLVDTKAHGEQGHPAIDALKRDVLSLCSKPYANGHDTAQIIELLNAATGGYFTIEGLQAEQKAIEDAKAKEQAAQGLLAITKTIAAQAAAGDTMAAIDTMAKAIDTAKALAAAPDYAKILAPPTIEGLKAALSRNHNGLSTQYWLKSPENDYINFALPVGLTYICGLPAHGKSRMLLNLALYQAEQNSGDVLYLTFEETAAAVTLQGANMFANLRLSSNNRRTLTGYYTNDQTQYFSGQTFEQYKAKETEYFRLLTSGRLRIIAPEQNYIDHLTGLINHHGHTANLRAVFIDYVQLLKIYGCTLQKREELSLIAQTLWQTANALNVPIVLGAQFNRNTCTPVDMHPQNIAESADLERSANTILGLWNSKYDLLENGNYRLKNGLTEPAKRIEGMGFTPTIGGKMYAKLLKCRGGEPNTDIVLQFDGNRGTIYHDQGERLWIDESEKRRTIEQANAVEHNATHVATDEQGRPTLTIDTAPMNNIDAPF